jgi:hypothetical protein
VQVVAGVFSNKKLLLALFGLVLLGWVCFMIFATKKFIAETTTISQVSQNSNLKSESVTQAASPTPEILPPSARLKFAKEMLQGTPTETKLDLAVGHLMTIPQDAREFKEAQTLLKKAKSLRKAAEEERAKAAAEEALLGPKPENSAWDGTVQCVDKYLKETLNDYDSAEYMEWSPVTKLDTKEGPYWVVRLKLRAQNAFGGKIVKNVIFFIRQNEVVKHTDL